MEIQNAKRTSGLPGLLLLLLIVALIIVVIPGIIKAFRRQPVVAALFLIFFFPGLVIWALVEIFFPKSFESSSRSE